MKAGKWGHEGERITPAFFSRDPVACARELIGCHLVCGSLRGRVVETEAYAADNDEACHTAKRPSARAFIEKYPAGSAYVYFTYGMHWMLNVLVKSPRSAGFVLFRALEPLGGLPLMRANRKRDHVADLCSGPGKLARAFGVEGTLHGRSLLKGGDWRMEWHSLASSEKITSGPRVGISRAIEHPWRFALAGSRFVSSPRPVPVEQKG